MSQLAQSTLGPFNILPDSMASISNILPKFFAGTTSINLEPINNILLDPLAEITYVRIVPDNQAHHSTPQHSEAQKHALLNEEKEMPWTPQQALVNLTPIGDALPKFFAGTTSINPGPIGNILQDPPAEITDVRICPDQRAHLSTPHKDLTETYQNTYMLLKPGTTVIITSTLAPAPYVPEGLYNLEDSNLVQLTMRDTDVCPLTLLQNKPITVITVQLLDEDYYEQIPISRDTLQSYFLSQEIGDNTPNPTHNRDEPA